MPFTIHREKQHDRVIRMGQAARVITPEPVQAIPESVTTHSSPPVIETKPRKGKKMADEKKLGHETGVKKISQEPADKQGPVGTGAQEQPRREPGEEVKIGGDKESEGGKEE